jgi:hypothetical protein
MIRHHLMTVMVPVALGTACFIGGNPPDNADGGPSPDGSTVLPFQADSPFVYVDKVKNILTGLPATQTEIDTVANAGDQNAQQAALVTLIDTWMTYPQYTQKMKTFFELSFQQTQLSQVDFNDIVPNGNGSIGTSNNINLLIQNVKDSFALTVLDQISKGQPFTDAFTTTKFMMTPALAELYSFMDWNQVSDTEKITDAFAKANATNGVIVTDCAAGVNQATCNGQTTIDYASETINPSSPNYMHWYFPGLNTIEPASAANPAPYCQADSRAWVSTNNANTPSAHLVHFLLYGGFESYKIPTTQSNGNCGAYSGGANANGPMTANDFSTWTLVNVRAPNGTEGLTPFWHMPNLRSATELVLKTPRVGFFSTPAFHANWPTNTSNEMRVTINQAFIVALGAQVDGTDSTPTSMIGTNPPGLDQAHTAAGQACVGCHQILDPSRSILMTNYSDAYGTQTTPPPTKGWFVFNGVVNKNINTLTDFGTALTQHPYFADAWVQKLCYFVNSEGCDPTDPEFTRIRDDFKSGYSWKKLVEDLLSSPITTNAIASVTTTKEGEMVSVARRDHLCRAIDARLKLVDSCGLDSIPRTLTPIEQIAGGLPSDGYGRGAPIPVLPTSPTLFYRAGLENICENVANMVVDNKTPPAGAVTYASTDPTTAISHFVTDIMGIVPDDPRSAPMTGMLTAHYNNAIKNAATKTDALKSTFVVSCLSPNVAGIGM